MRRSDHDHRLATVRDVREQPAMYKCRRALQRAHDSARVRRAAVRAWRRRRRDRRPSTDLRHDSSRDGRPGRERRFGVFRGQTSPSPGCGADVESARGFRSTATEPDDDLARRAIVDRARRQSTRRTSISGVAGMEMVVGNARTGCARYYGGSRPFHLLHAQAGPRTAHEGETDGLTRPRERVRSPMLVVVLPSPAGVGVMAETSTSRDGKADRRGRVRTAGSTLTASRPNATRSPAPRPRRSAAAASCGEIMLMRRESDGQPAPAR